MRDLDVSSAAAERIQDVAHGASRGFTGAARDAPSACAHDIAGRGAGRTGVAQFALWATVLRCSAAGMGMMGAGLIGRKHDVPKPAGG